MTPAETINEPPRAPAQMDWEDTGEPLLDISAWMPSEIKAITPLVDRLLQLVEESHCHPGDDLLLKLALREALYNAVVHGNRLEPTKFVQVRCRCEREKGIYIVVKYQGQGCDLNTVPDPLAGGNLQAARGRGILQAKHWMDEVWFEQRGTEVHMRKRSPISNANESERREQNRLSQPSAPAGHCVPCIRKRSHPAGGQESKTC